MGSDRKSTRLNSSHLGISYAVFCLKKKEQSYIGGTVRGRRAPRAPLHTTPLLCPAVASRSRIAVIGCPISSLSCSVFFFFKRGANPRVSPSSPPPPPSI